MQEFLEGQPWDVLPTGPNLPSWSGLDDPDSSMRDHLQFTKDLIRLRRNLDGQRQLVIVRRDNVEHLLMIGGPNDVVVESQILRVAAPARDKDAAMDFVRLLRDRIEASANAGMRSHLDQ